MKRYPNRLNNDEWCEDIHFGNLIKDLLKKEGRNVGWFAQQMNCDRSNMYKILSHCHLDSGFLLRASVVLNHDFFKDGSAQLKSMMVKVSKKEE
jgi:hypothetical protein